MTVYINREIRRLDLECDLAGDEGDWTGDINIEISTMGCALIGGGRRKGRLYNPQKISI